MNNRLGLEGDAPKVAPVVPAPDIASDRKARIAEADKVKVVPRDKANIAATLPHLQPVQRDDILKQEDRIATAPNGETGMMFTNGTGTGKTFTGLGVVKRYAQQGKKNILIIAPSDKVLNDWKTTASDFFDLDVSILPNTKTAGEGIVATSYAALGSNEALADRDWDLIVADESHYLNNNQTGAPTGAQRAFRAIAGHPDGVSQRARMQLRDELQEVSDGPGRDAALLHNDEILKARQAELKDKPRSHAVFLSATPFAYDKNVDYAEGFLFSYDRKHDLNGGYNQPGARDAFMQQHFGYRMRIGKLTQPDAEVDSSVMERAFHEHLKETGALSARSLEVEADYERRFATLENAEGAKIDQALEWLATTRKGRYQAIHQAVMDNFTFLKRRQLLEAIKAREIIPTIQKLRAEGRKVVVFHDYNVGGGFNPFKLTDKDGYNLNVNEEVDVGDGEKVKLGVLFAEFVAANKYVRDLNFTGYLPPVDALSQAFPDALVFNGRQPKKERRARVEAFNEDGGDALLIVQSDAGAEGISLHDTTGQHKRVLINIGMPTRPTRATQIEGRIYRVGQVTDAMIVYPTTGSGWERAAFAGSIAERAATAENLAMGEQARGLRDSFMEGYAEADVYEPGETDGRGGKDRDRTAAKLTPWEKAKSFYYGQGKKKGRRDQREGIDYFATPEPVGLKMVELANAKFAEKILEPSAGHGAISRWFPEGTQKTVIEPSPELSSRAALASPGAKVINSRFEDHNLVNKYDAIVMNPPFGSGGKTAIEHLAKAARHLKNGGRIVALIPTGPAADAKFEKFNEDPRAKDLHIVASIKLPTSTFERAGTSVSARIVVLEKQTDADVATKLQKRDRDYSNAENINDLFDRIENLEIPPRLEPKTKDLDVPTDGEVKAGGVDYKLTVTKKGTAKAKPKRKLGILFRRVVKTAEKHGGVYGQGQFAFPSTDARAAFLQELNEPAPEPAVSNPAEPAQAAPSAVKFKTSETKHTKTGADQFIAAMEGFQPPDIYDRVNRAAKRHGGFYSRWNRGFTFTTEAQRQAFLDEMSGGRTFFALAPVRTQLRAGAAAGGGTAQPNAATYQALNQRNYQTLIGGPGGQNRAPGELLTRFDRFRSNYQDAFIAPMRVMQEAQRRRGRHLEDYENVYLQEKTYAGRVGDKMSEVQFGLVEPAIEAMAETGLTMEQLDEYLAAKHAPERNAQIARINPRMPDGGSGMTTADANAITARYESGDHAQTVRIISRLIRRMRVRAIRWRVGAGLMNAEQAKRWLKAYRHYVPLKGWDDISNAPIDDEVKRQYGGEANQPIGGGKSFTIKGGESRRALGRGAGNEAATPFVQFITDVEEAIVRGEKNRILQSVLQLARAGDMNDFVEEITVSNVRVYNPSTGLVETQARNPLLAAEEANHVTVKEDGQERRIRFNDAELAKAFKQTGNVQLQGAMRLAQAYSMYFSQVTTSYNPAFLFVNLARDIGAFTVTAPRFRVPGMRRQMARHYFSGNAFGAAYRGLQGNYRGEWGRWFKRFQRAGGKISFFDIGGVESKAGQYRRRIRARQGDMTLGDYDLLRNMRGVRSVNVSVLHRVANIAADNIELVNLAADNALRISVFRAAIENGVSEQEAATMARDVTVDFNKKGFRSSYVNALFTFTNAGVQGTETLLRAVTQSRAVQANIGLLVLAGFAQELANGFLGEEDDDEQLPYDKINDYTLEHNIVIMAGGEPITIPLQYGINVPFNLGRIIGRSVRAGMGANIDWSAGKAVKSIVGTVAESVFPLYESVGDSGPLNRDSVIKTLSPTITDPLVELATNKTFTGGKVRPDNPFDRSPESQQYFNNVSEGSKIAANAIGAATGGSKYEAGGIDTSPENIDHIMTELAGGGGAFLMRLLNLAEKAVGGKFDTVENYDIPIARRFRPEVGIHADRSLAYDRAGEALGAFDSVKSALLDQYVAGKLDAAKIPITDDMLTNRGRFKVGAVRDYISVATEAQIRQLGMTPGAVQQIKDGVDYNDARRLYDTIGSRLAKLYEAGKIKEMGIPIELTDSGNIPAKAARAWLRSASVEDAETIGLSRRAYHAAQFDKRAKGVYDALAAFRRQRVKAEELPNEARKLRIKEIDAEEQKVLTEWNRVFLRAILRGEAAPEPIEDEAKAG